MKKKNKKINFFKPTISKKDLTTVLECLVEENFCHDAFVRQLTSDFNQYYANHVRTFLTSSPSAALYLIFKLIDLKEKQEVILSPLTNAYVVRLLRYFKAVPVFCDLKKNELSMDERDLKDKITAKTKVVIVNHHFGIPHPWENLDLLGKEILILEDVTNGLGSRSGSHLLGSRGKFAFFSLDFDKIITAVKGGGIIAQKHDHAKLTHILNPKNCLEDKMNLLPLDFKLNDLNAALASSELSLIDKFIARRREIADYYRHSIDKSSHSPFSFPKDVFYNHSFFPFFTSKPLSRMKSIFAKHHVEVKEITEGTAYETQLSELEQKKLKNLHHLRRNLLLIPLYPTLKKEEIERIGKLITLSG